MRPERLVLSCEHGGNCVPRAWAALFAGRERLLASHRGWDRGALALGRELAALTRAPLVAHEVTRLLVDANRPPDAHDVFSTFTAPLDPAERASILARHHVPHWRRVADAVARAGRGGARVLHVAVHTFTPVRNGDRREVDVGLLYDPRRPRERRLAHAWRRLLRARAPELRVRLNAPYRGDTPCLPTSLRRALPPDRYLGIELEVSQRLAKRPAARARVARAIAAAFAMTGTLVHEAHETVAGAGLS